MKTVSREEMTAIDTQTIEQYGMASEILMELAGLSLVKVVKENYDTTNPLILCGSGNNGGDGFVAAKHLALSGYVPHVVWLGKNLSDDAKKNYEIIRKMGIEILQAHTLDGELKILLKNASVIIDCIFGTGLHKEVEGFLHELIGFVNQLGKKIVAADIPSGIDCSNGKILGIAIKASATVTMGLIKNGLLLSPGCEHTGKIYIANLGFPSALTQSSKIQTAYADPQELIALMPHRKQDEYKGSSGKLLLIAGSNEYSGAPVLSARSAQRIGCGMVYLAVPNHLEQVMQCKLTETIIKPYTYETFEEDLQPLLKICQAIAIGPGMGNSPGAQAIIRYVMKTAQQKIVADADTLYPHLLQEHCCSQLVLTPHTGEMSRLLEKDVDYILSHKMESALAAATRYRADTLLKGPNSIIAYRQGQITFNLTGNAAMATAGSGDVLTGIIGGLLAQNVQTSQALVLGTFIHGACGDLAAETIGKHTIIASDLIEWIPKVTNQLLAQDLQSIEALLKIKKINLP